MRKRYAFLATGLGALSLPLGVYGQPTCTPGFLDQNGVKDVFAEQLLVILREQSEEAATKVFKTIAPAPASNGSALVQGASLPRFVAVAVENELIQSADGKTNIQFTPWAWMTAFNPSLLQNADAYDGAAFSRRFVFSLSSGGEGEKFDRNGDGVADDPLTAKDFNDIQTYELKFRLFGSRDWKERRPELAAKLTPAMDQAADAYRKLVLGIEYDAQVVKDASGCYSAEQVRKHLADPARKALLRSVATAQLDGGKALEEVRAAIGRSWITSLVGTTTQQKPEFGQDKWSTGLRVSYGDDKDGFNFDLDYTQGNGRGAADDPNSWKLGAEYVRPIWKKFFGGDGVRAGFSVAWERFNDVPDQKHDDVAKVGLRLSIPVGGSGAVQLPLSIIYANHEDLLSDSDTVRGHIGITVDFGDALKKQAEAPK